MDLAEYKTLAKYYDLFYQNKDYKEEVSFIDKILRGKNKKTILDVGCGTGSHLAFLEQLGYDCVGVDLNKEMLEVAKDKVKAPLFQADMTNFKLDQAFDAVICMYAAFNHLLTLEDAGRALECFGNHLNPGGLLLIDLYNPTGNGTKTERIANLERTMEWKLDPKSRIETTKITFKVSEGTIITGHTMRGYKVEEMRQLFESNGFNNFNAYENYTLTKANPNSRNIEVIGLQKYL
jgi:SAM-dependent methyltransferase